MPQMQKAGSFFSLAAIGLLLMTGEVTALENCTIDNVEVKISRVEDEYGWLTTYYFLSHSCPFPVGIKLRKTGFYQDGSIAFSEEFWPGSVTNLPPNVQIPFESGIKLFVPIDRQELVPIEVNVW